MKNIILTKTRIQKHIKDPLYKNSLFLMGNLIVGAISGFLFWMVVARCYSPIEVGLATALISAITLLALLSRLGFDIGLIRFLPNEDDKHGMLNSCFTITTLFSIVLSLVFISGINFWSPALLFVRGDIFFLFIIILFTAAFSLYLLQTNVFVASRIAYFSFLQSIIAGLRIPLAVLLTSLSIFGIISSWGIAICTAFVVGNFLVTKVYPTYRPMPIIQKDMLSDMFLFSFGNYVAEIFRNAPITILPLVIVNVLSPEMAAYFYIAFAVAGVLFMIPFASSISLFAEGSYEPDELLSNLIRAAKFIFTLLIPAILCILFLGDKVLMLFGKAYPENGIKLLWIFAFSSIPIAFNYLYIAIKRVQMEMRSIIYIYAFIAFFTIGAGYMLMIKIGLIGIGIGWILSQGIVTAFIAVHLLIKSQLHVKSIKERIV